MKLSVMHVKVFGGFLAGAVLALSGSYWVEHRRRAPEPGALASSMPAAPNAPKTAEFPPAEPLPSTPPNVEVQPPPAPHRVGKAVATRPKDVPARPTAVPTIPKARETANREPAPKLPPYSEPEPPKPVELAAPAVVPETPVAAPPAIEAKPEERVPHSVTIPDGTVLRVRIGEAVSTKKNRAGDAFSGTLDQELVADGFVIAERGAKVEGRVSQSEEAGRTRGLSHLGLELTAIHTSDGQIVRIQTARFEQLGTASRMEDWAKVGVGTAIGGAIGAAAGGGKGAAIGAAAGAAAGAGTAAATRTKPAEIAVETRISFKLEQPVMLTEKLP